MWWSLWVFHFPSTPKPPGCSLQGCVHTSLHTRPFSRPLCRCQAQSSSVIPPVICWNSTGSDKTSSFSFPFDFVYCPKKNDFLDEPGRKQLIVVWKHESPCHSLFRKHPQRSRAERNTGVRLVSFQLKRWSNEEWGEGGGGCRFIRLRQLTLMCHIQKKVPRDWQSQQIDLWFEQEHAGGGKNKRVATCCHNESGTFSCQCDDGTLYPTCAIKYAYRDAALAFDTMSACVPRSNGLIVCLC